MKDIKSVNVDQRWGKYNLANPNESINKITLTIIYKDDSCVIVSDTFDQQFTFSTISEVIAELKERNNRWFFKSSKEKINTKLQDLESNIDPIEIAWLKGKIEDIEKKKYELEMERIYLANRLRQWYNVEV